jgi:undecaprenyl-diphosphatase
LELGLLEAIELKIVEAIQSTRIGFFDYFFSIITYLGDELFFLAITVVIYWCVSKRTGYKFLNVFLVGQIFVGVIKTLVGRLRPYKLGADAIFSETQGASFPSGHSHNIASISMQICLFAREKVERKRLIMMITGGILLSLLVMYSRIYLGQHYLSDVLCGASIGVIAAFCFSDLFELLKDKEERIAFVMFPLTVVLLIIVLAAGLDISSAGKLLGAYGAATLGYYLEKRFVKYEVKSGKILNQIIKVFLGILIVVILKEGIKFLGKNVTNKTGETLIDYLRYFSMGIFGMFGAPALFKAMKL